MEGKSGIVFFIIVIVLFGILAIIWLSKKEKAYSLKVSELKNAYNIALQAKDKCTALEAGRNYYRALRKDSILTIYDEQAIANDLAAIS